MPGQYRICAVKSLCETIGNKRAHAVPEESERLIQKRQEFRNKSVQVGFDIRAPRFSQSAFSARW